MLQRRVKRGIGKGTSSLVPPDRRTGNTASAAEARSWGDLAVALFPHFARNEGKELLNECQRLVATVMITSMPTTIMIAIVSVANLCLLTTAALYPEQESLAQPRRKAGLIAVFLGLCGQSLSSSRVGLTSTRRIG